MITKATVSLYPQAGDRRPSPWPGGGGGHDTAPKQGPRGGTGWPNWKGPREWSLQGREFIQEGAGRYRGWQGSSWALEGWINRNMLVSWEGTLDWHLSCCRIRPSGHPPSSSPAGGPSTCPPMVSTVGWASRSHLVLLPPPSCYQQSVDLGTTSSQPGIISVDFFRTILAIKKPHHTEI